VDAFCLLIRGYVSLLLELEVLLETDIPLLEIILMAGNLLQEFGTAEQDAYRRDLTINRYKIKVK
jgi:hypothetical protein